MAYLIFLFLRVEKMDAFFKQNTEKNSSKLSSSVDVLPPENKIANALEILRRKTAGSFGSFVAP